MPEWVGQLLELAVLALLAYERRRAGHDFTRVRESVDAVSKVVVDSMRPPPLPGARCVHLDAYEVPDTVPAVVWCRACGALQRGRTGRWRLPGRDSTPAD